MDPPAKNLKPLTSLRFFAAMSIVFMHSITYFPWANVFQGPPLIFGVSFFFVLSGFILTHVYEFRSLQTRRFMLARFARLWPTHAVTFLMVLLLIRPDSQQLPGSGWFDPWLAMAANILLVHAFIPFQLYIFSWNTVSWSISTEVFFYIFFPTLLINIAKNWYLKIVLCFLLVLIYGAIIEIFSIPYSSNFNELNQIFLTYSSPLFRLAEFVTGMTAYVLSKKWRAAEVDFWRQTITELMAFFLFFFWFLSLSPVVHAVIAKNAPSVLLLWFNIGGPCFIFALIIAVFSKGGGMLGLLLSVKPLVWLGQISFALYMVHQIAMKWLFIKHLEGQIGPAGPLLVFGLCIALAACLHHIVELPLQARLTGKKPWFRGV